MDGTFFFNFADALLPSASLRFSNESEILEQTVAIRTRSYKKKIMLSSAEPEILNAHKYEYQDIQKFSSSDRLRQQQQQKNELPKLFK